MLDTASILASHKGTNRRQLLSRAGLLGAAALGSGLLNFNKRNTAKAAESVKYGIAHHTFVVNDYDILNFALNFEYLGAEYYTRAATGVGLASADTGLATSNVSGGTAVPFVSSTLSQIATEFAADELAHVRVLRDVLGKRAVDEPPIDFTDGFTALAVAAGVIPAGQTFDPFASDESFILGAFIFEDVDVTAYIGAAPYVHSDAYLSAAAGILAVEGYHAATIRTLIFQAGGSAITDANLISALRNTAATAADPANPNTDVGVTDAAGNADITPNDANSLAYGRTFAQCLNIAYGSTAAVNATTAPVPGALFPAGLNGRIR